jgi:hypothetical protein
MDRSLYEKLEILRNSISRQIHRMKSDGESASAVAEMKEKRRTIEVRMRELVSKPQPKKYEESND